MIPNLANTVLSFAQSCTLIRVQEMIVNYKPVFQETTLIVKATLQPAKKENLNKEKIDWSLKYLQVHSLDLIKIGDIIIHRNIKYKAIENADYNDYGFYESIMEEQK